MSSTTLLRYARVRRPKVHDLASRAAADPELKALVEGRKPGRVREAPRPLSGDYRRFFNPETPVERLIPGRDDLDPERMDEAAALRDSAEYQADVKQLLRDAVLFKLEGRTREAEASSRQLQLLEALPTLASRRTRETYAPAVLGRFSPAAPERPAPADRKKDAPEPVESGAEDAESIATLLDDLSLLWRARNREISAARAAMLREAKAPEVGDLPSVEPAKPAKPVRKGAKAKAWPNPRRAQLANRMQALRERQQERAKRHADLKARASDTSVTGALTMPPSQLAAASPGISEAQIRAVQDSVSTYGGWKPGELFSFCDAFEAIRNRLDPQRGAGRRLAGSGTGYRQAPAPAAAASCFGETPVLEFGERVELLGIAELIKLEEHFMGYSEAEISYVENILAGEFRVREVKTAKEFEQIDVESSLESSVTTEETRATTTQSLASEIASAVNSRLSTDVAASASGSAGGTVGVVSLEGQGSLDLGAGFGLDTSFASTERSEFGSEIIEAATEAVTKSSQNSRTTRTKSLFETVNRHEIDNRGDGATHRRGVYCFLNKHVCVTETPYGLRWFLKATLVAPGRNLLCDRLTRLAAAMGDSERPPAFEITPADIHPSNYLELAGLYKAQGLEPPPPAIRHVARTYKTDQTNLTTEQSQGLERVGQALMPLFKAYKRHLVTDTVGIPDGYAVLEVRLAINHGANGLSVPVDLPVKLAAAGFLLPPSLYFWGVFMLPMALWQVLLLASPLLHHNTDSSAVTATIGTEAQESHYYFFEADFLVREIMQMIGGFASLGPGIMEEIGDLAAGLPAELNQHAADLVNGVRTSIDSVSAAVGNVFGSITGSLANLTPGDVPGLINAFLSSFSGFGAAIANLPSNLFEPLNDFITEVVRIISEAAQNAMSDLLAALVAGAENNQERAYAESFGMTGDLPVSLNIVSIKPGITVNLVACVGRTDEALDAWRIETFGKLHQSYLQLVAAYESKSFFGRSQPGGKSPGTMRQEEREAIRHLVIHGLNKVWPAGDPNRYTLDRLTLFEHAVDWASITWRVYGYGPGTREIDHDRQGVFNGADTERRAFLNAAWAQVMLPLAADPALEQAMLGYFESGATDIGAGLGSDELTALWRDVILRRDLYAEAPEPLSKRRVTLPTDVIVLRENDSLPSSDRTPCGA